MKKNKKNVVRLLPVLLFMFAFSLTGWAQDYPQKKIDVEYKGREMKEILKDLTQKIGVDFLYNLDEIKQIKPQTFEMKQVTVKQILDRCFGGTMLGYKYKDGVIVVTLRETPSPVKMIKLTGKVTLAKNEPLVEATVSVKGTTLGVATDMDGNYVLNVPEAKGMVIVVSFVGMKTQEVGILPNKTVYDVHLEEDEVQMDDVVVTGYANINRSSFTGNAVTVKKDELLKVASRNLITVLQTFDPSLRVQENNEWGSDPNALPEFYIRGRSGIGVKDLDRNDLSKASLQGNPNLPIFIMDGFEISVEKVYDFDMNRIESITILKDAAATAMYGSRAANGVIVITTVAPKPGEIRFSYNFTGGITAPDLSDYNLMNAREKLEAEKLSGYYDSENTSTQLVKEREYQDKLYNVQRGVDTYWLSKPLRTVFTHQHSLYLEGGSQDLRFGVDMKYDDQGGVMKESGRKRMGAGFALDYRLKSLQIKNYISYNVVKSDESPYGSFRDYTKKLPYDEYKDEFGNYLKSTKSWHDGMNTSDLLNPLYEATLRSYNRSSYRELIDNVSVNWYVLTGLQLKGEFSITKKDNKTDVFTDPRSTKYDFVTDFKKGELTQTRGESVNWNLNATILYNRMFGKHGINATVGLNMMDNYSSSKSEAYRGFPSEDMSETTYAYEITGKPSETEASSRLCGFLGLLNYTYDYIYLMDLSCRLDGSSEFGVDKKFAPFWSTGLGVNVHNYAFMKEHVPYIEVLKIRGSYGQTGKVNFPAYSALTTYDIYTQDWYSTGYGAIIRYLGNRNLKWEKTNTWDVGFDFASFRGALDIKFSYYNKKTVDLVTDVSLPSSSGFNSYKDNMGEVVNRGIEINVKSMIVNRPDFLLSVFANLAHNKNEILKITDELAAYNEKVNDYFNEKVTDRDYSKVITKYEPGGSLTSIFGMRSMGIDPANGNELYLKRNGTATYDWDPAEMVIIGNSEPDAQGSFGLNVTYKNFSLYTSFLYEFGGQRYNYTLVNEVENADVYNYNVDKRVMSARWQKLGDVTPLKNIKDRDVTTRATSRFVQDYNVLSLNTLTLGYDFKQEMIRKWGFSMLRLQFNMTDVARFSTVKQERGLSYPFARTFNVTLNASF